MHSFPGKRVSVAPRFARLTPRLLCVLLATLAHADVAFAQWGEANWGEFSWSAGLPAVPLLGPLGLAALILVVIGLGAWAGRSMLGAREDRQP